MTLACVTGGDGKFFLHLLLLISSFRRHCPERRLHICDFGLSDSQIRFLERHAVVHPMPDELRDVPHPWYRKASLSKYLEGESFDGMVWIDADCLVTGDAAGEIAALAQAAGHDVMACAEGGSLEAFIAGHRAQGRDDISHFAEQLSRAGVAGSHQYLNSGVFWCRSCELLAAWRKLAYETPPHVLFEQNAFNTLARLAPSFGLLDGGVYNLNGARLDTCRAEGDLIVNEAGQVVRIVHFTAGTAGNLDILTFTVRLGDKAIKGTMRQPRNAALKELERGHLSFFVEEAEALDACGLLETEQ